VLARQESLGTSGTMLVSLAIFKCRCHSCADGSFRRRSLCTLTKLNFYAIILHYFASMTAPRAVFQFDKEWESQIKARSMYGGPFCLPLHLLV